MRIEPHRCGRAQPDKRVAVAGAGVGPVALVGNVVGVDVKRDAALLTAGRVARAQVEEIVAGHADLAVARGLLACGEAPAWHQVQAAHAGHGNVGEEIGVQVRHVDHLLVIESWRAGGRGNGVHSCRRAVQPQPAGGFAFGIDRLLAILANEDSIREVITFPKTSAGICPLTEAPSDVDEKQLKELNLTITKGREKK